MTGISIKINGIINKIIRYLVAKDVNGTNEEVMTEMPEHAADFSASGMFWEFHTKETVVEFLSKETTHVFPNPFS